MALDASGNVYIADPGNHSIRKVNSSGIITTYAGSGTAGYSGDNDLATSAELSYLGGVAVDTSGNVYIADTGNNVIRMVAKDTNTITTIAGNGTFGYSGDGTSATLAAMNSPFGVTLDLSGNVYIADAYNNRIRLVTKNTGIITAYAGTGIICGIQCLIEKERYIIYSII